MQALIDFDGWRKWKDFSQSSPVSGKKGADVTSVSKTNATATSNISAPNKNRDSTSNSNSTGSSGSASARGPPIPDTLTALNAKSESADTLDSVSTTASGSSGETAAPLSSSTATLTAPQGNFSRQPSTQGPKHPPQPHPPPLRPSATDPVLGSSKQHLHAKANGMVKEERRRKRSSLGHSGLSGVVEEMEDAKELRNKA